MVQGDWEIPPNTAKPLALASLLQTVRYGKNFSKFFFVVYFF